ncbi:YjeF N-terminal domain-containing protein [Lipomyces oligophaga]|uniref:YjeF N-terminal domain-containing protein n=1 Tax=Lipomyces oligophaga TaxID=45792 RepID=UPI0034CE8335
MSDKFIGLKVSVKLQNESVFVGIVSEIIGTKLRLVNVYDATTNSHALSRVIDASKIADLQIVAPPPDITSVVKESQSARSNKTKQFQDPAIMVVGQQAESNMEARPQHHPMVEIDEETDDTGSLDAPVGRKHEPAPAKIPKPFTGKVRPKKNRQKRNGYANDSEEWASEDTAMIKDTEFDFQGMLDKFNKQSVFEEIRNADTTDPGQRLVSFNRKDGTNGVSAHQKQQDHIRELLKKPPKNNYLPSENVLASSTTQWQNGFADLDESDLESVSNLSPDDEESEIDKVIRQQQQIRRQSQNMESRNGTPPVFQFLTPAKKLLYDTGEKGTGFECPTYTRQEIQVIEQATASLYGVGPIQLTENAGSAIARIAISILGGKKRFEKRKTQLNALPVVVVLAGNHETGARAIAGARMLVSRRIRVIVLFTDDSTELATPKESVQMQLRSFKATGGKTTSRLDVLQATLRVLDAPAELIIEAMSGLEERKRTSGGVPGWMYETVQFTQTQKAPILALDNAAGVDPDTGAIMVRNMGRARWLVCLGLPSTGIPRFMQQTEEGLDGVVEVSVVDIGIPSRCFRKVLPATAEKLLPGVVFGSEWQVPLMLESA